jgi:hypothetical protein
MATLARSTVSAQATMEVVVLHTNVTETLQALKTAAHLAHDLSARIRLLVLEVVPYPLPLDHPNVSTPFTQRRFRTLAANASVETSVDIHLVRDPDKSIESLLEPHSVNASVIRSFTPVSVCHESLAHPSPTRPIPYQSVPRSQVRGRRREKTRKHLTPSQ